MKEMNREKYEPELIHKYELYTNTNLFCRGNNFLSDQSENSLCLKNLKNYP